MRSNVSHLVLRIGFRYEIPVSPLVDQNPVEVGQFLFSLSFLNVKSFLFTRGMFYSCASPWAVRKRAYHER
jgi:hypothetical protein